MRPQVLPHCLPESTLQRGSVASTPRYWRRPVVLDILTVIKGHCCSLHLTARVVYVFFTRQCPRHCISVHRYPSSTSHSLCWRTRDPLCHLDPECSRPAPPTSPAFYEVPHPCTPHRASYSFTAIGPSQPNRSGLYGDVVLMPSHIPHFDQ